MNGWHLVAGIVLSALVAGPGMARAATFVYVSNAEDGNIGMYTLQADGTLQPGPRFDAGKVVMPLSPARACGPASSMRVPPHRDQGYVSGEIGV